MGMVLRLQVEIVTPLFLGGADPRAEPELRGPSLRGAMRFWFRALLGGVVGGDLTRLRDEESRVFGSTEQASALGIRVKADRLYTKNYSDLVKGRDGKPRPGLSYLLFAARATKREVERKAFSPGQNFSLELWAADEVSLGEGYAALWLLGHLGGLGSRSRRGAGGLQMRPECPVLSEMPPLPVLSRTPEGLAQEIREGLGMLRGWAAEFCKSSSTSMFSAPPEFCVLHPDVCRIFVLNNGFPSWQDALDSFGSFMQGFRNRREPDYSTVKNVVLGRNAVVASVERAAFGLPILFHYRSLGQGATLRAKDHERRASPLFVRVVKLANGTYTLVLVWFRSKFLPDREKLLLRTDERPPKTFFFNPPDETIIQEFLKKVAPLLPVNF